MGHLFLWFQINGWLFTNNDNKFKNFFSKTENDPNISFNLKNTEIKVQENYDSENFLSWLRRQE